MSGMMGRYTSENGVKTKSLDLVLIPGSMGADTPASGILITWRVLAPTFGQTLDYLKVSTKTTRSMAMEFISGKIIANTAVNGSQANNTVLGSTKCPQIKK